MALCKTLVGTPAASVAVDLPGVVEGQLLTDQCIQRQSFVAQNQVIFDRLFELRCHLDQITAHEPALNESLGSIPASRTAVPGLN